MKRLVVDRLLNNATAFFIIGRESIAKFQTAIDRKHFQSIDESWLSVASANIVFATELFLKCLHMIIVPNKKVTGHELRKLFKLLPSNVQTEIEVTFNRIRQPPETGLGSFRVLREGLPGSAFIEGNSNLNEQSLLDILISHDTGFQNWRYSHEISENPSYLYADLNALDFVCRAIGVAIQTEGKKKGLIITPNLP